MCHSDLKEPTMGKYTPQNSQQNPLQQCKTLTCALGGAGMLSSYSTKVSLDGGGNDRETGNKGSL